jgi:hypothetical protein
MSTSTIGRLFDPRRLAAIVLSMLLVAPFGFGIPLLIGSQIEYGLGIFAMLILVVPSIWGIRAFTRRLGQPAGTPNSYLIGGCFAPLLTLFLYGVGFVTWESLCESDTTNCGDASLWLMAGLVGVGSVFAWVWGTSALERS